MKSIRNENNMVVNDLLEELMLYVLEFTGQVALGRRLNAFAPNVPEDAVSRKLLENVHDFFKVSDKLDFQPNMWRLYPTKTFRKAIKIFDRAEK